MCQPDPITTNPFLGKCFPCHGLSWWPLLLYFPSQPRQTAVRPKLSAVSVIRETLFSSFSSTYVGLFCFVFFLRAPSPSHHQVCSWGHDSHQLLLPLPLCVWERRPAWHCVLFCTRRPAGGHVGFFAGFIWLSTNQCTMGLSPLKRCIKEFWQNVSFCSHFPAVLLFQTKFGGKVAFTFYLYQFWLKFPL